MSDIKIVLPINEKEYRRDCQLMYEKGRTDAIEIVHRFFKNELDNLETYIDDDELGEIYVDIKEVDYLLKLNKRLCEKLKEYKNE